MVGKLYAAQAVHDECGTLMGLVHHDCRVSPGRPELLPEWSLRSRNFPGRKPPQSLSACPSIIKNKIMHTGRVFLTEHLHNSSHQKHFIREAQVPHSLKILSPAHRK